VSSLKSPLNRSVILGGMSPLLIRSMYSAATLSGPITASSVALTPSMTRRYSPECRLTSALASRRPATAAPDSPFTSATSAAIASIILMNAGTSVSFADRRPAPLPIARISSMPDKSPWAIRSMADCVPTWLSSTQFTSRATSANTPW